MPYAFQSETSDLVHVKKSKIPNAGKGLFAKKNMPRGEHVALYFGVMVHRSQVDGDYYVSDYFLEEPSSDWIIDAADPKSCLGRYSNDSLSLEQTNAVFGFYKKPYSGYLKLTKSVRKGDEIYTSYGPVYWEDAKQKNAKNYTSLPKEDKDFINNILLVQR